METLNTTRSFEYDFAKDAPPVTEAAKPLRSQGQQTPFSPLSPKKFSQKVQDATYDVPQITTSAEEDKPTQGSNSPAHTNCRRIFFEERYSQGSINSNLTLQIEPHIKHATPNSPSCPPPIGAKAPQCTPTSDNDHIIMTNQNRKSFESDLENLQDFVRSKENKQYDEHGSTEQQASQISYHIYSPSRTSPVFHVNGSVHVHSHPLPSLTRYLNPRESEELQKQFYYSKFNSQVSHF